MCAKANNAEKPGKKVRGPYNSSLQSLLDIWNVLAAHATPEAPLTAGQIAKYLDQGSSKNQRAVNNSYLDKTAKREAEDCDAADLSRRTYASAQTVDRLFPHAADIINNLFPHTVLREDGQSAILHTYSSGDALHVVLENPDGVPLWNGNMTAILTENPLNPIPYSSLTRMLPQLMAEYDAKKSVDGSIPGEEHPPISLAGVVAAGTKGGVPQYIPAGEWETRAKAPAEKQSPTRRFFLESILSPAQWRILSDLILVYPYISEEETNKFLSAMKRLAPGVRNWSGQRYAPKNSTTVNFEHIQLLDSAIELQYKVTLIYGKYVLTIGPDHRWHPQLQPTGDNGGRMTVEPYAMMWSNGYYYLVCRDGDIMRNLRVDRIMKVLPTTVSFQRDPDFDPYAYRDRSPVMYPGQPTLIRLRCHTDRLSTLMDFFGTAISDYSTPRDGYTVVTLRASEKGVRLFALQYADQVTVLEPPALRSEVAQALRKAVEGYSE